MNADQILSISKCGDLYPYGVDNVKMRYKELSKEWHPDTNDAEEALNVFIKITELYKKALNLLEKGLWEKTNYILLSKENDNTKISLDYDTSFEFELGVCYVSKVMVFYVLDPDKEKYYHNAVSRMKALKFGDRKMKAELGRFLPNVNQTFRTKSGEYVIVLIKAGDVYPLKTVYEYFRGKIDGRHVAWIISRLCSLTCFLKFNGIVHNGININNCFIAPKEHTILLLGGWWYTTYENEKMIGTSKEIYSIMPISAKEAKISSSITDLESVKQLGRHLLGESNCRKLSLDSSLPKPLIHYLTGGSGIDSFEEFERWDMALDESYGKRIFITMEVNNLYNRKGE